METNAYSDMLWFNCVKTETMTYRKHDLQKKKKKRMQSDGNCSKNGRREKFFTLLSYI